MPNPRKPIPVADPGSEGFWQAARERKLAIQRCVHCRTWAHPPGIVCRSCLAPVPAWRFEPVSGLGRIRSWTVFRQSFLPGFSDDVPYVVVDVELDEQEGLRILGRLVDGPDAGIAMGARVAVTFDDRGEGVVIPEFSLTGAGS